MDVEGESFCGPVKTCFAASTSIVRPNSGWAATTFPGGKAGGIIAIVLLPHGQPQTAGLVENDLPPIPLAGAKIVFVAVRMQRHALEAGVVGGAKIARSSASDSFPWTIVKGFEFRVGLLRW